MSDVVHGRLRALLGSAGVDRDPAGLPRAIPDSPDALSLVCRLAHEEGWKIRVEGQGTWLPADAPADLAVSTRALDQVLSVSPADLVATVQAGTSMETLRRRLADHGMWLAIDPPGRPERSLGSVIATATAGPLRHGFGPVRDHVLGCTVATGDGRLVKAGGRVVKNVAGYDLTKLQVGGFGGFGIVAHPDSPKPELAWTDWSTPFDAIELLNPDTSWRKLAAAGSWSARGRLLTALIDYPWRASEVMAGLLQPTDALGRWEDASVQRRVVMLAGTDAHARLGFRGSDPGERMALPLPGYEASFKVTSIHVRPERPLTGRAEVDAVMIARAIRNGHVYTAVDGLASPPRFDFNATNERGTVRAGDVLGVGGPVALHVESNAPDGFTTIVRDGTRTLSSVRNTQDLTVHGPSTPGVFWAEIVDGQRRPPAVWLRSNPIYVRAPVDSPPASPVFAAAETRALFTASADGWTLEHDRASVAAVDAADLGGNPELRYRFGLADGPPSGQYTSLVYATPNGVDGFDRLSFTIRAERPMRVSVQVRDTTADRWQRSVFVDAAARDRTVGFDDLRPVGVTHAQQPQRPDYRSLMFVVDTTNTKPGTSGRIWLKAVRLEK